MNEDSAEAAPLSVRSDEGWRRVHPVTPVLMTWKVLAVIFAGVVFQLLQQLSSTGLIETIRRHLLVALLLIFGALLVLIVVSGIYSILAWRQMSYRADSEAAELRKGILFKQQRRARLTRLQAVDIVQPLLGRIFGLAQVRLETAGSGDSVIEIGYLRLEEAEQLRIEILARAAGIDPAQIQEIEQVEQLEEIADSAGITGSAGQDHSAEPDGSARPAVAAGESDAPATSRTRTARPRLREAGERIVLRVPSGRLIGSLLASTLTVLLVLLLIVLVAVLVIQREWGVLTGLLPPILLCVIPLWTRFVGYFDFTAATSADGIRLRRGLLESRAQTVAPRRVQGVRVSQPLLWRPQRWWKVDGFIAGYGDEAEELSPVSSSTLLPVGTRSEAMTALWLVLPDLGVDDVPTTLDAAFAGEGESGGFIISPRSARWLDPFARTRQGVLITGTALFIRRGWLRRTLYVIPHERTQSLAIMQGPLERRLGLADLHAHTVAGPGFPIARHLDAEVAGRLLLEQAERARAARHREGPEEWLARVEATVPEQAVPEQAVPERAATDEPAPVAASAARPGDSGDG